MAKPPKWMILAGGATVVLVGYTLLTTPDAASPRSGANAYKTRPTARKATDEQFRPEDYTIRFPAVNVSPRDAFKPLVAKTTKTLSDAATNPDLPNGIPAAFTGGDANWIYTGNAEVDGVPNALLENTSSQETVFLRPGERWKRLTVARITPNLIDLIGPTGQRRSVRIAEESGSDAPVAAASGGRGTEGVGTLPPVGRGLTGQIGASANSGAPAGDNRTNRGNRRNRRNDRNPNNANNPAPAGATSGTP